MADGLATPPSSARHLAALNRAFDTIDCTLLQEIFDHLPDTPFAIKNRDLRYVNANQAMADLCGVPNSAEVIGKSAGDFFAPSARHYYESLDWFVLHGRVFKDQLHLTNALTAPPRWVLLSRFPIKDPDTGAHNGVAIVGRTLGAPDRKHPTYQRLAAAIDYINANLSRRIRVTDLAKQANISVSQFERDFAALFSVSPSRFIANVRFEAAFAMLRSDNSVADIAQACGYCDQSAFTRRFRETMGASPREFRRRLRAAAPRANQP